MDKTRYDKLMARAVAAARAIYRRTRYDVAERACWHRWLRWTARQLEACKAARLALRATSRAAKDYASELDLLNVAIAKAEGR